MPMSAVKRGTEVEKNLAQGRGIFRIDRNVEVQERRTGGREKSIDLIVWFREEEKEDAGVRGQRRSKKTNTTKQNSLGGSRTKERTRRGREREREKTKESDWAGSCERQVACLKLSSLLVNWQNR